MTVLNRAHLKPLRHRGTEKYSLSSSLRASVPQWFHVNSWIWAICLIAVCSSAQAQKILLQKDSKRECATCHLDWVVSFEQKRATLLVDRPDKPQAAEEPMCLGCHDGSVGDSRRGVWLEHGHRMKEKPSDKIKVPDHMPLDNGKMVCRTCHTAHTVGTGNDLSKMIFLRGATEGGLCQQCHVDRSYGEQHGSHPLAKLPFELPKELHDAHARTDMLDRTKMACQTCHTTHGARQDHLLVMPINSSQLCLTCHEKMRPTEWAVDAPREHPQNPPVKSEAQKNAIADMGTKLGPGDTLMCFSCHRMHDNKGGKFMLADSLNNSAICIRCHEDRKIVLSSQHDLRKTRPEEKNRMGFTPDQSGPCGACHSFHRYARTPAPGRGDPKGLCISCHQPKGPSVEKGLGFAHPPEIAASKLKPESGLKLLPAKADSDKLDFACLTCHDPHESNKVKFLRKGRDELCNSCHTERFGAMAGAHDFESKPDLKNAKGQSAKETGKCGFCHGVHGDTNLVMWVGTRDKPAGPDDLCLSCHKKDGLAAKKPAFAFNHPTGPGARQIIPPSGHLPLYNEQGFVDDKGFVACASCHDPHVDSTKQKEMLRVTGSMTDLCIKCHADYEQMAGGPHDGRGNKDFPVKLEKNDLCSACHKPHSNDASLRRFTFAPAQGVSSADGTCVRCHEKQSWNMGEQLIVGKAVHPTTLPAAGHLGSEHSGLPLARNDDGTRAVSCASCHNLHQKDKSRKMLRVGADQPTSAVCAGCHTETKGLSNSMHARDALLASGKASGDFPTFKLDEKSTACAPCHVVHATQNMRKEKLWSGPPEGNDPISAEQYCISCHATASKPEKEIRFQHPADPIRVFSQPPAVASTQPTTRPALHVSEISCSTCHLPHGQPDASAAANLDLRRACKPMLRTDTPQMCGSCHGADASRLMLFWHSPKERRNVGKLGEK